MQPPAGIRSIVGARDLVLGTRVVALALAFAVVVVIVSADEQQHSVTLPPIDTAQLERFVARAAATMDRMHRELDRRLSKRGARQPPGSPAWYMAASHAPKRASHNVSRVSRIVEQATKYVAEK